VGGLRHVVANCAKRFGYIMTTQVGDDRRVSYLQTQEVGGGRKRIGGRHRKVPPSLFPYVPRNGSRRGAHA
jgi:hypothetical protein